jgi:LAO/AO transport system kinase
VLSVTAKEGAGIDDLVVTLDRHRAWLSEDARIDDKRRSIAGREIGLQVQRLLDATLATGGRSRATDDLVKRVANRHLTPSQAAEQIFREWSADL